MTAYSTQCALVLAYMRDHGGITPAEALMFDCYRLSARIYDLRRDGHDIVAQRVASRSGGAFARYSLRQALPLICLEKAGQ